MTTAHNYSTSFHSTGIIEPATLTDEEDNDHDIGYETGPERASSSSSVSDAFDFRYENGRRYHGYREGRYPLPNDTREQNRLDIVHNLYLMLLDGKLHMVDFQESPNRILDIGTGTGIWAVDMAMRYESAEVIGTDLSPIQPTWTPSNCRFEIADAESEWIYCENSFDFIHSRHLGLSIENWPQYIDRIYEHLKPGGWVQLVEHDYMFNSDDGTFDESTMQFQFWGEFQQALIRQGKDAKIAEKLEDMLRQGGFTDISSVTLKLPLGSWAKDKKNKEIGSWTSIIFQQGLESYGSAFFSRELQKSRKEIDTLINGYVTELESKRVHAYHNQRFVIARKGAQLPVPVVQL